jgi:hypothetical protein
MTFYIVGGIKARNITDLTFQFDGTLFASFDLKTWPNENGDRFEDIIKF